MDEQAREQELRRQTLAETREKIFAADTAIARLESEAELLKRQIDGLDSQQTKLTQEIAALSQEKENRQKDLAADLEKINLIESENKNNVQLLQTKKDQLASLKEKKQESDQRDRKSVV